MKLPTPDFKLPNVLLYNSDCYDVLASMPDGCVDLVFTDPPYLVDYRGRWGSDWANKPMMNDKGKGEWITPVWEQLARVCKPDCFCISYYGWPEIDIFMSSWKRAGWKPVSHLAFVKPNIGLGYTTRSQHETAFLLKRGKAKPAHVISDVIPAGPVPPNKVHPAQKPLLGTRRAIEAFCPEGGVVLDPYCGSATTLIGGWQSGRRVIGVESGDNEYGIAVKRLEAEIDKSFQRTCMLCERAAAKAVEKQAKEERKAARAAKLGGRRE